MKKMFSIVVVSFVATSAVGSKHVEKGLQTKLAQSTANNQNRMHSFAQIKDDEIPPQDQEADDDVSDEDEPIEDAPIEDAPIEDAPIEDAPIEYAELSPELAQVDTQIVAELDSKCELECQPDPESEVESVCESDCASSCSDLDLNFECPDVCQDLGSIAEECNLTTNHGKKACDIIPDTFQEGFKGRIDRSIANFDCDCKPPCEGPNGAFNINNTLSGLGNHLLLNRHSDSTAQFGAAINIAPDFQQTKSILEQSTKKADSCHHSKLISKRIRTYDVNGCIDATELGNTCESTRGEGCCEKRFQADCTVANGNIVNNTLGAGADGCIDYTHCPPIIKTIR